ncbi:unnamed protein product [Rangifer tarandus platyrhynchus]|uniref:Uncharacterized protein n=1 Tax=Rangifer tarandus platyrhynchus TaxID=3082113 RepID=A0AC59YAG8_RANTA
MKRLSSALISAQAFNTSPANGTHTYCEPGVLPTCWGNNSAPSTNSLLPQKPELNQAQCPEPSWMHILSALPGGLSPMTWPPGLICKMGIHAVAEGGKPAPGGEDVRDPGGARRRDACLPWAPHAIQASTCDALLLARPAPPWV